MNRYGDFFHSQADAPVTEYAIILVAEDGVTFYGSANDIDYAVDSWAYHAECYPDQIIMLVERTITYTDWTSGPIAESQNAYVEMKDGAFV